MRIRELTMPYLVQEIDYRALQEFIAETFVAEHGQEALVDVQVDHFNPDLIDVSVLVTQRVPAMNATALQLSETLRRDGLRVGINVVSQHQDEASTP
jgi:S-adenosylmethionine synthetase